MAQDIDLTSDKWLQLVFEKRNKHYGAYAIRNDSSNRHLKAILIVGAVMLATIVLPRIISAMAPVEVEDLGRDEEIQMVEINQDLPEEDVIKAIEVPPPPELKQTIAFPPPNVVDDDKVTDENILLTQQDLLDSDADISIKTIEGTKDGVDIAELVDAKVVVKEEEPEVFSFVEKMPMFPGGNNEINAWLAKNIVYPEIAKEQGIQGTVSLRFVVRADGTVSDVQVVKSLERNCDQEAVRAVKKMPKWIPGEQNGKPVNVYFSLPVRFKLAGS
jgi:protein TonB